MEEEQATMTEKEFDPAAKVESLKTKEKTLLKPKLHSNRQLPKP
ncbi:hypothetical protein ACT3CD_12100 [Geofilum sp. OHC36d9]